MRHYTRVPSSLLRPAASDLLEASLAHSAYGGSSRSIAVTWMKQSACLAEAYQIFGGGTMFDHNIFRQVAVAEMMLALELADTAGVVAALSRLNQMLTPTDFPFLVLALLAEAQVMVGNPEQALNIVHDFMVQAPPENVFAIALANCIKGLAQQALGQTTEALASLNHAGSAFTAVEMPFEAARAHLEWAALVAANDTALAVPALLESLAVFEHLGSRRYVRHARRLLYKLGTRPRSTHHPHTSTSPLSPRELEIVLLVAKDMTNAEIAEQLIISQRTVTTHLDRIYTRLGINSRTALVLYAIEVGLLPPKH